MQPFEWFTRFCEKLGLAGRNRRHLAACRWAMRSRFAPPLSGIELLETRIVFAVFSIANASAAEGSGVVFTITLSNAVVEVTSVTFTTTNGTATTDDSDYTAVSSQTVFFTASTTSQTVTVNTTADDKFEANEVFTVTLSNPSVGTTIAAATATGTITNDDLANIIYEDSSNLGLAASVVNGRLLVKIENVSQTQFDSVDPAFIQSITITGGTGADSINLTGLSLSTYARLTRVSLNGGAGNDTIVGSNFDETISGGLGNDSLNGAGGTNTLSESGDVNFMLTNTSLVGAGTDMLANLHVANLTGGTSKNTFTVSGWTRAGTLVGGGGTGDTIVASKNVNFTLSNSLLQTTDGMNLSLSGFTKAKLTGGVGNNTFTVGSWTGTGKLTGGTGTDTLSATRNARTTLTTTSLVATGFGTLSLSSLETAQLTGGVGNNLFTVTGWNGTGSVTGGGGTDTIVASRDTNFMLSDTQLQASNGLTMTLSGLSIANLTGGASANRFTIGGWTGSGKIDGSTNATGTFDQIVAVRDIDMTLTNTSLTAAGFGTLTLVGIETAKLSGGATANKLIANHFTIGSVTLQGGDGDDLLIGSSKNNSLFGGTGRDTIIGGVGDDTLQGGDDDDTLIGGLGIDCVFGDSGNDLGLGGRGSAARFGSGVKDTGDILDESVETINEAFATIFAFE